MIGKYGIREPLRTPEERALNEARAREVKASHRGRARKDHDHACESCGEPLLPEQGLFCEGCP